MECATPTDVPPLCSAWWWQQRSTLAFWAKSLVQTFSVIQKHQEQDVTTTSGTGEGAAKAIPTTTTDFILRNIRTKGVRMLWPSRYILTRQRKSWIKSWIRLRQERMSSVVTARVDSQHKHTSSNSRRSTKRKLNRITSNLKNTVSKWKKKIQNDALCLGIYIRVHIQPEPGYLPGSGSGYGCVPGPDLESGAVPWPFSGPGQAQPCWAWLPVWILDQWLQENVPHSMQVESPNAKCKEINCKETTRHPSYEAPTHLRVIRSLEMLEKLKTGGSVPKQELLTKTQEQSRGQFFKHWLASSILRNCYTWEWKLARVLEPLQILTCEHSQIHPSQVNFNLPCECSQVV